MDRSAATHRAGLFVGLLLLIDLVQDGPPKVASSLEVQFLLLPVTLLFCALLLRFLRPNVRRTGGLAGWFGQLRAQFWLVYAMECAFACLFLYETRHFAAFGYRFRVGPVLVVFALGVGAVAFLSKRFAQVGAPAALLILLSTFAGGQILSMASFPLNYLRSDMLPVIFWADRALLAGENPYQTFHVAERLYDFPYLPGMLIAFAPAQALHLDLRWASLAYIVVGLGLVVWAAHARFRMEVTALVGLFALSPYLQYRHELYTQGHLFSLILIFVLMQRRKFAWSASAFGASMVISQFSWVIFPFFLLDGLRRGGWREVARMGAVAFLTAAALFAPFVAAGAGRIAHNTVGQWDLLLRPIARPMNLSFWASYVVRPSHLKWVQLTILSSMFLYCWVSGRCADLADTLRWMIAALTVFILFNVLVDGYFYLMLLVPMLVYTCVANGWWADGAEHRSGLPNALRR